MSIMHRIETSIDAAACMRRLEREPKETAADYVLRTLVYNIQMLYMPPGSLIREPDIAGRLGVSRTPVHEAVKRLVQAHLAYVAPKRATFVSLIDMDAHVQGRFARTAIEPLLIDELQGRLTDEQKKLFADNVALQRKMVAEGASARQFIQVDDEFHHLLYTQTGKELVWEATRLLAAQYDRLRYIGQVLGYQKFPVGEHDFIYDILLTGDVPLEDIRDMVDVHLRGYTSFVDRLTQDHPEYFLGSGGYAETL